MGLRADELESIRTTVEQFLPNRATISRTSTTVDCRVDDDSRDERVSGMPHFIRLRRFAIQMPDGTDVKGGDTIAVTDKGTYYVEDTANPTDNSVDTVAFCVMTRDSGGALSFPTNTTVTFRNPRGTGSGADPFTAAVFLSETSLDLERFPEAAGYKWSVLFDPSLGVRGGWEMTWTDLVGESHTEILTEPTRLTDFLPIVLAHVKTQ